MDHPSFTTGNVIGGTVIATAVAALIHQVVKNGWNSKEALLHASLTKDNEELIKLITSTDPAVLEKLKDKDDNTIVHLAAQTGAPNILNYLQKKSLLNEHSILKRNNKACLPLHLVCSEGPIESFNVFLQYSSSMINSPCFNGWNPLLLAASKGHLKIVSTLINLGADISHKNADGHNALMICSFNGFFDLVKLLVHQGSDIYASSNKAESALFLASVKGNVDIARFLLEVEKETGSSAERGRLVDAMAFNGGTPLHAASEGGHAELVALLLEYGASVDAKDITSATPLHLAASVDSIEVIKLLVKSSDLDAPNTFGSTPLHDAVFQGKSELVKVLLEHGASIKAEDHDGLLPIHSACRSQSPHAPDILKLLIANGADVNALDTTGRTPLQMCAVKEEQGNILAKILLEKGADFTIENDQGWNALHVALSEYGYEPTAALIREHAQFHNPEALRQFSPEKPRRARNYDRPPKFTSLNDEQRSAVFGGNPPSLAEIAKLISENKIHKVVVLTGAGISVNAGIPDFRNPKTGIYSPSVTSRYGLSSGSSVFDVGSFYQNPLAIYDLVNDIFIPALSGKIKPTPTHRFIKYLHDKGILLRNFTQNVDGLEYVVGLPEESVVEAHGSFSRYRCVVCNSPYKLPDVQNYLSKGYPFASLVNMVEDHVPRLLFNLEEAGPFEGVMVNTFPLRFKLAEHPFVCSYAAGPPLHHLTPNLFLQEASWNYRDVSVPGDCDASITKLAELLGWPL